MRKQTAQDTAHESHREKVEDGGDDQEKLAQYRLSVLDMAEAFGPSEAARQSGVKLHTLRRWRDRYAAEGLDGLKDGNRPRKPHPLKADEKTESLIESYAVQHPTKSAEGLAELLDFEHDIELSHVTVQRILNSKGLGQESQRLAAYDIRKQESGKRMKPLDYREQEKIRKTAHSANPALKDRKSSDFEPGNPIFQFGFQRRSRARGGAVYVQVIVDPATSMAWAKVHARKKNDYAESFFRHTYFESLKLGMRIHYVITDNGPEFCSDALFTWRYQRNLEQGLIHSFTDFLRSKNIAHGKFVNRHYYHAQSHVNPRDPDTLYEEVIGYDVPIKKASGIVERFYNTLRREFFDQIFRENPNIEIDDLQGELATWIKGYNEDFTHLHEGYPNFGQTPKRRLEEYLKAQTQKGNETQV